MSENETVVPSEAMIAAARAALVPLFRHGGSAGTGISYGWNPGAGGFGIWDHEHDFWFPDQEFVADVRDIDGPGYFARRALMAAAIAIDEFGGAD